MSFAKCCLQKLKLVEMVWKAGFSESGFPGNLTTLDAGFSEKGILEELASREICFLPHYSLGCDHPRKLAFWKEVFLGS